MGSNEFHPDDFGLVLHLDHEPVLVAAHIEHNPVVASDAGAGVVGLDVLRCTPGCLDGLKVPTVQRSQCVGTPRALPEPLRAALHDDPHRDQHLPFWEHCASRVSRLSSASAEGRYTKMRRANWEY